VGTALSTASSVWFTLSQGILTEVYYPFVDTACTRDLGLLVADGSDFFAEEQNDTDSTVEYLARGVPPFRVTNCCQRGRFRITKEVIADPRRSVVLQQVSFQPSDGKPGDLSLFVLLNPHLGNYGADNTAWVGEFKGLSMLFARRKGVALALACSQPWKKRSAGYVGVSDGWQDISCHKRMAWCYERAEDGNVALTGEVDLAATDSSFVLALGFGRDEYEAGHQARASLLQGFADAKDRYVSQWNEWQKDVLPLAGSKAHSQDVYRISAAVMRTHESKYFPGGIVASLAIPWGFAKGDQDWGYHLVWARDMVQTVGGLLALNKHEDVRRVLFYFQVTQDADGHWPQNMLLNGFHHWNGIQLDEIAFVILHVGIARREKVLDDEAVDRLWPMIRKAVQFLVINGPLSPMDRWEENSGYFVSTMPVEIAALLVAAELAEARKEDDMAAYLRETADAWNDAIDELLYVTGTELARGAGVEGYYVRFAQPDQLQASTPAAGFVDLKNHPGGRGRIPVAELISPDALCLVRFGLRAADDPRIINTLRAIDKVLKTQMPNGPCWHRYNRDGYGEHADGSPYDGVGIGRAWPLLTGERAHYELAAGRKQQAEHLLATIESFASESGLFPEQIWDAPDIPDRDLYFGRPSGSAMPLVWAHAEYVKLRRSLNDGRVFDLPQQTVDRYLQQKTASPRVCWRFLQQRRAVPMGKVLRLELTAPAVVRWSSDSWRSVVETKTRDTGLGVHLADLSTQKLGAGAAIDFTFFWPEAGHWEGRDFRVEVQ
jgi:glucoamylase